jgi:hypothetical protein
MRSKIEKSRIKFRALLRRLYHSIRLELSDNFYISLGENCLTDNILDRHGLKSFGTPYSHGRSNIDYALKLEQENYSNLLKIEHLSYGMIGRKKVVRNTHYFNSDPIYNEAHRNGFEFTHHDVISVGAHRRSSKRKIKRLQRFRGRKNIQFFYHYRINRNRNLELIIVKAKKFLQFYEINNKKCDFIIFTQDIVTNYNDRGIDEIEHSDNIKIYILKTMDIWAGENRDMFWARKDDDLIERMLKLSKKRIM